MAEGPREPLMSQRWILNALADVESMQRSPGKRLGRTARERLQYFHQKLLEVDFEFHRCPRGTFGENEKAVEARLDALFDWYNRISRWREGEDDLISLEMRMAAPEGRIAEDTWEDVQTLMEGSDV